MKTNLPGLLFFTGLLLACSFEGGLKANVAPLALAARLVLAVGLLLGAVALQPKGGG